MCQSIYDGAGTAGNTGVLEIIILFNLGSRGFRIRTNYMKNACAVFIKERQVWPSQCGSAG